MKLYSLIDSKNIVQNVICMPDVFVSQDANYIETWIDAKDGLTRFNYGIPGSRYDAVANAFILPPPFPSWILNTETFRWEAPVAKPSTEVEYKWNEANKNWDDISVGKI